MRVQSRLQFTAASVGLMLAACGESTSTPSTVPSTIPSQASTPSDSARALVSVVGVGLEDTELWVDGEDRGPLGSGMELEVTPGEHVFEARQGDRVLGSATGRARTGAGLQWLTIEATVERAPEPPREATVEGARLPGHVVLPTTVQETRGEGEFDPALVVRAIAAREQAFDDCYELARGQSPDVRGTLTLLIVVLETGIVIPTELASGTIGEAGNECVRSVIGGIRFNPGPLDGEVIYELALQFLPDA